MSFGVFIRRGDICTSFVDAPNFDTQESAKAWIDELVKSSIAQDGELKENGKPLHKGVEAFVILSVPDNSDA
jgi:hypothetical protein